MGNKPLINNSPYLGLSFINNYIESNRIEIERNDFEIKKMTQMRWLNIANKIAEGNVVGWLQGKWSLAQERWEIDHTCDPRNGDMQATLNIKIKRRESCPFVPSLLDKVDEWPEKPSIVPYV